MKKFAERGFLMLVPTTQPEYAYMLAFGASMTMKCQFIVFSTHPGLLAQYYLLPLLVCL